MGLGWRFTSFQILYLETERGTTGQDGYSAKCNNDHFSIPIVRPWQHDVRSPAEAPAEVSSSSFHSQCPAASKNLNLEGIKYIPQSVRHEAILKGCNLFRVRDLHATCVWVCGYRVCC